MQDINVTTEDGLIIKPSNENYYHFAVYHHRLVVGDNRLIQRNFIVIKDKNGDISYFTRLHKYIVNVNEYLSQVLMNF